MNQASVLKGILHPKMSSLALFTHVVPSQNTKQYLENCLSICFCPYIGSQRKPVWVPTFFRISSTRKSCRFGTTWEWV